ncbi:hypothetical protein GWI33_008099 [Rhynchophorus ferrugineus]|uniref:Uncharacterized protein n=1 Tax=Rhynchophorus ferrugineus TaxID=354439 RepID=A0A834IDB2_RHYFE|nr:hypothetical protein GWI33_008099 [Rhynchophorus ferrugineus]
MAIRRYSPPQIYFYRFGEIEFGIGRSEEEFVLFYDFNRIYAADIRIMALLTVIMSELMVDGGRENNGFRHSSYDFSGSSAKGLLHRYRKKYMGYVLEENH